MVSRMSVEESEGKQNQEVVETRSCGALYLPAVEFPQTSTGCLFSFDQRLYSCLSGAYSSMDLHFSNGNYELSGFIFSKWKSCLNVN